jgi:putative transposase
MSENISKHAADLTIAHASRWRVNGEVVTVVAVTGVDSAIVEDGLGVQRSVRPGELHPIDDNELPRSASRAAAVHEVDSSDWQKARELEADLREHLAAGSLSNDVIRGLAARWGVSRTTVWQRIARYRQQGDLTAFIARQRGMKSGATLLSTEAEILIRETARWCWRQTENATVADIAARIQQQCSARRIDAPSRATIGRRVRQLRTDPEHFSGEARAQLRERKRLVRGHYEVAGALQVVQIDHTLADVLLIDPHSRRPIGRPTFTVAIDVATRCVMGFCLSLEAPSSLLVALCLEHAVFPKEDWLGAMGSSAAWPMYGRMTAIHCDNGKEFHSTAFHRGCDLNHIEVIYRPPATPRFGGHIERLIGTLMRRVRLLPGSTYSDMLRRRPKSADTRAALTMADLRFYLTDEIERYHHSVHRSLGVTPRSAWEHAWQRKIGVELPPLPVRRNQFIVDFLSVQRRVIGREGIEVHGLQFSHPDLANEIDPGCRRTVRLDPRDISRIYLERPDRSYLTVPLRRRDLPGMPWWEWRGLRKHERRPVSIEHPRRTRELPMAPVGAAPREGTVLRRNRRAARQAEWQVVQALQALPQPDVTLQTVMGAERDAEQLSWEILE